MDVIALPRRASIDSSWCVDAVMRVRLLVLLRGGVYTRERSMHTRAALLDFTMHSMHTSYIMMYVRTGDDGKDMRITYDVVCMHHTRVRS